MKTKKFYSPLLKGIGIACWCLFSLTSCKKEEKKEIPPLNVQLVTAQKIDVPIYYDFVGQVYGFSDVDVRARVDGWVTGKYFQEGAMVKEGQLLYTLDDESLVAQLNQAEGSLAAANVEVTRTKIQLDRVAPLVAKNALSKQDLDDATAAYQVAVAQKQTAEASVISAKVQLRYTKIYAPITGLISISNVFVGDYIGRLSNKPLASISQINKVRVRFQVSEGDFIRYEKATKAGIPFDRNVKLILPDGTTFEEAGKIDFVNSQIDPETGSITMEAVFDNKSGLLRSGLYVKVHMLLTTIKDAVVIPQKAVTQLQNVYQVYVIDAKSTLQTRVVNMGQRVGDAWIVESDLKEGDNVALVSSMMVTIGSTVLPVKKPWTPVLPN